MRVVDVKALEELVRDLALEANFRLSPDMARSLEEAGCEETSSVGRSVLEDLRQNCRIAEEDGVPLCQDCGLAVVFLDVGEEVAFSRGGVEEAVHAGIRQAYREGYLRKSVISDPLFDRRNTGDNTPAVLHLRWIPGDRIRVTVAPKGMGSENMSALKMLRPADGEAGVRSFVVETVAAAGPNACPPVVVGVGVGGNFETAPLAAKRALLRPCGTPHGDPRYAALERQLLAEINALGIGPAGYGGAVSALAVHVEWLPTHLAGLPVAVNLCCHANRHAAGELIGEEEAWS